MINFPRPTEAQKELPCLRPTMKNGPHTRPVDDNTPPLRLPQGCLCSIRVATAIRFQALMVTTCIKHWASRVSPSRARACW